MPYDKRLAKKKKFQTVKTSPIKLFDSSVMGTGIEKEMYIQLCRGIDLRPPKTTKDLICKYESRGKPYYTYGPRKVEIVNYDPYIAVVHDFITESEIKEFIKIASPKLKRSSMVGKSYNGSASDYRVSEQTWINEQMSPMVIQGLSFKDNLYNLQILCALPKLSNWATLRIYDINLLSLLN